MVLQLCEKVTVYGFGLDSEDGRMQVMGARLLMPSLRIASIILRRKQ